MLSSRATNAAKLFWGIAMQTTTVLNDKINGTVSSLDLTLGITDRNVLGYLAQFDDEETQSEKALEALKVGVIAIQSASPTLDTQVVQAKFSEIENRMREQLAEFQGKVTEDFCRYFKEQDGVVPRSIDGVFGDKGALARTFLTFFDPSEGKLSRLMQAHIGPESEFGKALNPQNKLGILALIEARVQELIQAKLDEVPRRRRLRHVAAQRNAVRIFRTTESIPGHQVRRRHRSRKRAREGIGL